MAELQGLHALQEVQLDGLLAPTHHYGALSYGNKASMRNARRYSPVSSPSPTSPSPTTHTADPPARQGAT